MFSQIFGKKIMKICSCSVFAEPKSPGMRVAPQIGATTHVGLKKELRCSQVPKRSLGELLGCPLVICYITGGFQSHGGTPKWMVYFMETPIKMDDLGVPLFQETSNYWKWRCWLFLLNILLVHSYVSLSEDRGIYYKPTYISGGSDLVALSLVVYPTCFLVYIYVYH